MNKKYSVIFWCVLVWVVYIMWLKQFKPWKALTMVSSIAKYCTLHHSMCDLNATSMSMLHSWISEFILCIRTRHAGHCWRSRDELISDVLLWTPTHGHAKAGRPAQTYIQQLCEDMGCSPEELPEAMNDREKWWEMVRDIRATSTTWWWWYFACFELDLNDMEVTKNSCVKGEDAVVQSLDSWRNFAQVARNLMIRQGQFSQKLDSKPSIQIQWVADGDYQVSSAFHSPVWFGTLMTSAKSAALGLHVNKYCRSFDSISY